MQRDRLDTVAGGAPIVRVVPFSRDECPASPNSGPPVTWREYYGFRNAVIGVLRFYGTVDPMGEMPILKSWESSEAAWKPGARPNPDFFVVADMWNEWNRWNRVEASPWLVSARLLSELVTMVKGFPGWCVYFAIVKRRTHRIR